RLICPSWFFNPSKLGLIDHLRYISLAFGFVLIPVRGGPMSRLPLASFVAL
ncbi:hypothetical protein LINGRAHAP2_LOCUS31758, partial [Linum grandiflorum]